MAIEPVTMTTEERERAIAEIRVFTEGIKAWVTRINETLSVFGRAVAPVVLAVNEAHERQKQFERDHPEEVVAVLRAENARLRDAATRVSVASLADPQNSHRLYVSRRAMANLDAVLYGDQ